MEENPVRLGLIGAGRIGRLHARHAARRISRAELRAIADPDEEARTACAGALGSAEPDLVGRPERLFERTDLDAVLICSPTSTHVQLIEGAAAAGLDVFCEKPLDPDPARIAGLLRTVADREVKLQVGFNRRFDASYARVRRAVAEGEIGEPHLLHLVSRDPEPPSMAYLEESGGLFLDMSIHDFDMARFLVGSEVSSVFVRAEVRIDPKIGAIDDVDTACTMLTFEDGTIGTIDNSRRAVYGYDQRAEVFGSGGSVETENRYPNTATVRDDRSVRRDRPERFFLERYAESYLEELREFVDAVRGERAVPVGAADGLWPVLMAKAAWRSLEEDRPVDPREELPPSASDLL